MTISFTAVRSACNLFGSFRTEHKQQNTSTRPPVTRYDCYRNDNKLCYFKMSQAFKTRLYNRTKQTLQVQKALLADNCKTEKNLD